MKHIEVGDLVRRRGFDPKVGIVVDKRISNEGLTSSMHVRHMINSYPRVFYVYFSGEGKVGPYHETDLYLQQSHQIASSIEQ